ncbi:hypothetical protein FS749_012455 [Ceratobasidium sp. UAMH 11750]|nr:hypothetical protein FS749_012455 [Ceratobasidium sp. UAMH 11750]
MGTAVSAFRETLKKSDQTNKQDVEEQLKFLVSAANDRLDKYQAELENGFSDKASIQRRSIPGNRALRWVREYTVRVDEHAADGIGAAVDSFFKAGEKGNGNAGQDVLTGFKNIIQTGLNAFLGNNQAGEHEEQKFFVFVQHNAIIRIDVKLWRYNFTGTGVMADSENVLCYIFCTSVVDRSALTLDELTFLLSEHAGDDKVEAYVDKLISVWNKMRLVPGEKETPRLAQVNVQN